MQCAAGRCFAHFAIRARSAQKWVCRPISGLFVQLYLQHCHCGTEPLCCWSGTTLARRDGFGYKGRISQSKEGEGCKALDSNSKGELASKCRKHSPGSWFPSGTSPIDQALRECLAEQLLIPKHYARRPFT